MGRRETGNYGEALVAEYLRKRRYTLIASQYRCRMGEIDLIARKGKVLCFVEVKTRSNLSVGLPREYVTHAKRERIRTAAALYLSEKGLDCPVRFDVAEVYLEEGKAPRIEYLESAF